MAVQRSVHGYSQLLVAVRPGKLQIKLKRRFNTYLTDAIREVPESERVILDTGDGAAVCFLGAPEVSRCCRGAAAHVSSSRAGCRRKPARAARPDRASILLGPVKLVKDINGALNAIGDGINAGQRIMSFASENQILVSQSFFEVVQPPFPTITSCCSNSRASEKPTKHVREHTVYRLTPLGSGKIVNLGNSECTAGRVIAATPESTPPPERSSRGNSGCCRNADGFHWLVAGGAVAAVAAVAIVRTSGSLGPRWYSGGPGCTTGAVSTRQSRTSGGNHSCGKDAPGGSSHFARPRRAA